MYTSETASAAALSLATSLVEKYWECAAKLAPATPETAQPRTIALKNFTTGILCHCASVCLFVCHDVSNSVDVNWRDHANTNKCYQMLIT